ncbi:hypothetical protein BSTP3_215 [Bacillus phage BSTP3]|nr:hypothetical protein BSTP3_215 [Bacillus phage BSTP3]
MSLLRANGGTSASSVGGNPVPSRAPEEVLI